MTHVELDLMEVQNLSEKKEERSSESDLALWNSMRLGNKVAFDLLYEHHVQLLYKYGMKITCDSGIVEDAIQELFIDLWNKRASLAEAKSAKAYLIKALKRRIIRQLSKKERKLFFNYGNENDCREMDYSIEQAIILDEEIHFQEKGLEKAIGSLSKRQSEVIYLRFYNEMSFEEIAEVMSLNANSTYKLVYKALDSLRKNLHNIITVLIFLLPHTLFLS